MPQELRLATVNVLNLALPGLRFYDNLDPYTQEQYDAKIEWTASLLDRLDADVIGLQEIFSQAAVRDVMARTKKYRDALHVGFEPEPRDGKLTPSVALISRLPLATEPVQHGVLPRGMAIALPALSEPMTRFTRPVLQVQVNFADDLRLNIFVVHLKSRRPDYRNGDSDADPFQIGTATLRSLVRRAAEGLGLRTLVSDFSKGRRIPLVVMGDFNDVATAVSSQLAMGSVRGRNGFDERLFDAARIQQRRDPSRDIGFTHAFDGTVETIDHVLLSEEFNPASRYAIGEVTEVVYVNDHVMLELPEATDHGAVLARIRLYGDDAPPAPPGPELA